MAFRLDRFLVVALLLTSAAVAVSAEEDDIDRTDFSDPALSEDVKLEAQGPHSDIETTWIIPNHLDGKVPIGTTTDLLVALANGGNKMFNMSAVEAKLLKADGTLFKDLGRYEYGQPLGPHEQRSFRYPIELEPETALGEYKLVAKAYYADKQKSPFFSEVCNETTELVPAPPDREAQMQLLQMGLGGLGAVMLLGSVLRLLSGGEKAKGGAAKKAAAGGSEAKAVQGGNEWLSGTLAGTENRSPKKAKAKRG